MGHDQKFEAWAIIELFGHDKIAGRVSEQTIGGCHFLRVDVPEVEGNQAFTQCLGQGAIFRITFVDETIAKACVAQLRPRPVKPYDLGAFQVNTVRDRLSHANGDRD